jgi:DNA-binding GntR family transcriptional regulator
MANQLEIAQRVVEAILSQKLAPGERLGEQDLADLYGVSRTLVREALMQLQARGFVEVRTRKGWYVVEPSVAEARDAFAARRAVETGLLRNAPLDAAGRPLQAVTRRLRQHMPTSSRPSTKPTRRRAPSCWPISTSAWPNAWATSCWPACCAT